jgi:hypothetical protein
MTNRSPDPPTDETWPGHEARSPGERVVLARRLFDKLERYVGERDLPWGAAPGWLNFQRPALAVVPPVVPQ